MRRLCAFGLVLVLGGLLLITSPRGRGTTSAADAAQGVGTTTTIAVARASGGIELVGSTGRRIAVLTGRSGWKDSEPAWSPDGDRIAFTRTTDDNRSFSIYVMRSDGSGVRRLTRGRFDFRPAWSPDGRWITFQSVEGLRVVHPDGTGNRLLGGAGRSGTFPAWAPDGRVAYTYHSESEEEWPAACRSPARKCGWIWLSRLDGSERQPLVRGRDPSWSADARLVAFTPPEGGVATVPAAGGRSRSLGRGYQADWSPVGRQIVFSRMGPTPAEDSVWLMNGDGSVRRVIVRGASTPAWRPS